MGLVKRTEGRIDNLLKSNPSPYLKTNFGCAQNAISEKIFPRCEYLGERGKIIGGNENETPLVSVNMFITCMNALMSLQSLSLCEGFTASLTRKGSFARMNQLKERNGNK